MRLLWLFVPALAGTSTVPFRHEGAIRRCLFEEVFGGLNLLELEGGFQRHYRDRGNWYKGRLYATNMGITAWAIAEYNRRYGKDTLPLSVEYIQSLTPHQAKHIYETIYWDEWMDTLNYTTACIYFSLRVMSPTYARRHHDEILSCPCEAWERYVLSRRGMWRNGLLNRMRKVKERCGCAGK